ncbi:MAG TPA: maleylpyruvate isomerase family mycothiol-dependent enzyme [Gemmatimonadales bacterium]|jgi:uncharacterized protein (TIGR03083 family)
MSDDSVLTPVAPVFLVDLFPGLHTELMHLLRGFDVVDWTRPTACALWSVKDIVSHLLDSCLRRLSYGRDRLDPTPDRRIASYADLVAYLNHLNAEWITATRRLSPPVLMDLMDLAAPQLHRYFESLAPHAKARFGVAWAGEEISPNWFDVGREYTERWLHQQQIREAVGAPGLNERRWLHPALDVFVRALPFTYREVEAELGTSLQFEVQGEAGGVWTLSRVRDGWRLFSGPSREAAARVTLGQETAWKLFSKSLSTEQAQARIRIEGDIRLGRPVLGTSGVMA